MGYRLGPGFAWRGEYWVLDLSDFLGKSLHIDASPGQFSVHPHVTKVVQVPPGPPKYPLKRRYDFSNTTLEGLECAPDSGVEQHEAPPGVDIHMPDIEAAHDLPPLCPDPDLICGV